MVADSITNSELFHGPPISRDFAKKRKTNWFCKLKQWKIDARRKQWVYQWKRTNVGEEENGCCRLKYLQDKLTDRNTVGETFSYLEAWRIHHEEGGTYDFTRFDDDETDLESASSASSPTSVLKNKDSGSNKSSDDCFCCSKLVTEEEEDIFDDAYDNWDGFTDALNSFGNEDKDESPLHEEDPNPKKKPAHKDKSDSSPQEAIHDKSSKKKKKKSKTEKQEDEKSECPICSEEMDETDLSFSPCPCGYQLCLFCHKRINEDDARCPSCRQKYVEKSNSGEVSFQQPGRGTLRLSSSFRGLDRA